MEGSHGVRLALCTAGELFGGVERQVLDLCRYWQRREDRAPCLVLFHDGELASRARKQGIDPFLLRGRHRWDPSLARQLAGVLNRGRITVLHAHGYKATVVGALARRRYRCALVKTEHGKVEPARGRPLVWFKHLLNGSLDRFATRRAATRVCYVTADIRRHFENAHAGLNRVTIANGIEPLDPSRHERPTELAGDRFQLGIIGRVSVVKGITYALRAMADRHAVPDGVCLNVVGSGPELARLTAEAAALGLDDRVRFHGFQRRVYDYIAHLDALLMPSLHEGLPYTLLEAMSLGTPVLAARVGGLAEVLRDRQTGLLFAARDVAGIQAAIGWLLADPERGPDLGRAARADQMAHYTLQRMGDDYLRTYTAAVAEERHHGS